MTHFGSKRRTLGEIRSDLKRELVVSLRLESLTVDELARRYSRLSRAEIEGALNDARKLAGMTAQQRFDAMMGGE